MRIWADPGQGRLGKMGKVFGAISVACVLAGCGGSAGSLDPGAPAQGNRILNVIAFGTPNPPPPPITTDPTALKLICPDIEVLDGTASLRFYAGGQSSGNVRYQYSLGEVARECSVSGSQIALKIGVEGRVLIGPAGSPGTFSVPVRIAVRSEKTQQVVSSKSYKVSATVPSSDTQSVFQVISEPLLVPLLGEDASQDYTIVVGFDGAGGGTPVRASRRRR